MEALVDVNFDFRKTFDTVDDYKIILLSKFAAIDFSPTAT